MRGYIKGISGNHIWIETVTTLMMPVDTEIDIDIKKHREKRSQNANAYYWTLIRQLSEKLHISAARIHNEHLRSMWLSILKSHGGEPVMLLIPDTDESEMQALEDRDDHIMPIPSDYLPDGFTETITKESGKVFRWYTELRGSRTFNTAEMSRLVDMTVEECKAQDIETMTPNELLRLDGYEKQSYRQ